MEDNVEEQSESAVIDRFEGKLAVVLIGEEERQLVVPKSALPRRVREGQWLRVVIDGEQLVSAEIDPEATEAARKRIAEKLERLRRGDHLQE